MRRTILALIIGFATLCGSRVMAVDFPNGFYAGASGGVSSDRDFCDQTGNQNSCDKNDFAWKIIGGYQFVKWASLEGAIVDLGGPDTKAPVFTVADDVRTSTYGVTVAGVFTAPVFEKIGMYAKLGGIYWDREITYTPLGESQNTSSDTGASYFWGLSFRYPFTDSFGISLEYENYVDLGENIDLGGEQVGESDVDYWSLGGIWRF